MSNMFDRFIENRILEVRSTLNKVCDLEIKLNLMSEENPEYKHIDLEIISLRTEAMRIIDDLEEFFFSKFSGATGMKKLFESFKTEYGFDKINDELKETSKTTTKKRK